MLKGDDLACRDLVELVTEYLEGTLPPELCTSLEAHLEICDGCRLYVGQMRLTIRALHHSLDGLLPPASRESLLRHFRKWRADRETGPSPRVEGAGP